MRERMKLIRGTKTKPKSSSRGPVHLIVHALLYFSLDSWVRDAVERFTSRDVCVEFARHENLWTLVFPVR
jgi:hypothetical protein